MDEDGGVGLQDLATLLASFGAAGDPRFDSRTDLDASDCVELQDLAILLANYGAACGDIVAEFSGGILTVTGTGGDDLMVVSRDPAGNVLVNNGAIVIQGGPATVATTTLIRMRGLVGADELRLDEANGPLPPAELFGGEWADRLFGGSGADLLDGGPGADTLDGRRGNDRMLGGVGDDSMVWNPGDGSDVVEGDAGQDTLVFNGSSNDEIMDFSASAARSG